MKKVFSLIFIGFLLMPAAARIIGIDFEIQVDRRGLELPRFSGPALFDNEYYLAFDQYINDSFSLRSPLIFAKNWLDYNIFRMTDTTGVHVGTDGWLYRRKSIEDFRKEACNDNRQVEWLILELHALEKIIEASGRRFLFMVAPNKTTIYPEYVGFMPNSASCDNSRYELFLENVATHKLMSFVRLDELLKHAKNRYAPLYDKASTFWNGLGALVAAENLHQQIDNHGSGLRPLFYPSFKTDPFGDLKRQLMGLCLPDEDKPLRHFKNPYQPDLPAAIVYGDDFMHNLLPYMIQMSGQLDVVQSERVPSKQHGEDLRSYEFILLEKAESELETLRIDLDEIYSLFEPEATNLERFPVNVEAVVPVSHISLDYRQQVLQIKSMGNQSVFELPSIPASDDNIFRVLRLSIETPHSDLLTIKYRSGMPHVVTKSLKPGLTVIYLPLPFQNSLTIQIQPSTKAGFFVLRSIEVLGFPDEQTTEEPFYEERYVDVTDQADWIAYLEAASGPTMANAEGGLDTSVDSMQAPAVNVEKEVAKLETAANNSSTAKANPSYGSPHLPAGLKAMFYQTDDDDEILTASQENTIRHNKFAEVVFDDEAGIASREFSIKVNDFEEGRIFQRTGRSADIVVSGSYSGKPGAIEARVVMAETSEEVVPWTVIDGSPQNDIFAGVLPQVPQGGWYNIEVRYNSNHAIAQKGSCKWGVGILVACLGQSNMREWFYTGTMLNAHELLRKFTDNGWSEIGNQGHAAIAFGNRIVERVGIPVGLLDYSKNGSGLRKEADWGTGYWEDTAPGSIYSRFLKGVRQVGGAIEFLVWIQGEADAARGTVTEQEYATSLKSFINNQVRADIKNGSEREYLPFLIVMMVKRPGGEDEPHQAIRNAQKYVTESVADCYLAATTHDLKNKGKQHLSPDAYITMGHRVAQTVLYILGKEKYYRGPTVSTVKRIDNRTLDIKIMHRGGTDFSPDSGISGWKVLANGGSVPIKEVYHYDSHTIRIDLAHPLVGSAKIRYLYGAMPDSKSPVFDNSPIALPLEAYQAEIHYQSYEKILDPYPSP
ncbi:MAG: hypothetical protein JSV31_14055 [Desulfobacterales bacterium]|nr:MAG: hypothetical protein JSV31_14055 [Desulfobacterales bacterium]